MERESAIEILEIVQEATLNDRLSVTICSRAEEAFAVYCENEDFEQFVLTVLDLVMAKHRRDSE